MEKEINKNLKDVGKNLPFTVPQNYFEDFALEMDAKIHVKSVSFKKLAAPWMYMVAMFAGILLLSNIFYSIHSQQKDVGPVMYDLYLTSQVDHSILLDYYNSDVFIDEEQIINN